MAKQLLSTFLLPMLILVSMLTVSVRGLNANTVPLISYTANREIVLRLNQLDAKLAGNSLII